MGVASMVIGIVAASLCWIPFCNYWAFIPAVVGLVLGGIEMNKKKTANEPRGMAVAGVVLNIVAIAFITFWTVVLADSAKNVVSAVDKHRESLEKLHKDLDKLAK